MYARAWSMVVVFAAAPLFGACTSDYQRLEATVVAQGQLIEELARTGTPTPSPRPLPTAAPSTTPSPTLLPVPSPRPSLMAVPTKTAAELIEDVLPAVVRVITGECDGTGFVAQRSGEVLTALHVVQDDPEHVVVLTKDGVQRQARVFGVDERKDLALLAVPDLPASPLAFGSGSSLGEPAIALGYSASLPGGPSVTRGIVSARRLDPETGVALVQTDATLNPGSSGGPLLNERGEVIGLMVSRIHGERSQYEGIGFAIATEELILFRDEVHSGRRGRDPDAGSHANSRHAPSPPRRAT